MYRSDVPQLTFALAAFLGQDMAAVRLPVLELTGSGFREPFGRSPVRLHFRHSISPYFP